MMVRVTFGRPHVTDPNRRRICVDIAEDISVVDLPDMLPIVRVFRGRIEFTSMIRAGMLKPGDLASAGDDENGITEMVPVISVERL